MGDTLIRRFAARLHSLRTERSLSQNALAAKSNLTTNYVGALERAQQIPSLSTLEQLSRGLKVDLASLVDFDETSGRKDDRAREEIALIQRRLRGCTAEELKRLRRVIEAVLS